MTQAVDFLVDGGVLLDISVSMSDIGFLLILIVVGYEILLRVIRANLTKFRG